MSGQIREVRVRDLFSYAVFPPAAAAVIWCVGMYLVYPNVSYGWIVIAVLSLISYFLLKAFLIGLVLVYKAFAPMSVREQCRFIPSCSTYMILAIKKYGVLIGVLKGIHRIIRCRPPNGGIDYP